MTPANVMNVGMAPGHQVGDHEREPLSVSLPEWGWAVAFMVSMSLCGLKFPLGYVLLFVILLNRFVRDRYDLLIQLTIIFGRFSLIGNETFGVKPEDIALVLSVAALFVCRRTPAMNKVFIATLLYMLGMFLIALTSEELMSVQIRTMRARWGMLYFMVPVLLFAGRDFDIKEALRRLFPYLIIMSAYYAIDGFILNGWVMLPFGMQGIPEETMPESTFLHPLWQPLSFVFPRMDSHGLFLMSLGVFPLAHYYKLSRWQWVLIVLAFLASRTMTVTAGLVVTYVIFKGHGKKLLKYSLLGLLAVPLLYVVDKGTGGFMRVQSTIDQFATLGGDMDETDMANFASGRGAQVLPKLDVLYEQDREWLGFGFLHPEYTKKAKFIIFNELYVEGASRQEVVTEVEVAPIQTILDMGYIGFIMQLTYFFGLYFLIRKLRYSKYYLSVLVCIFIFGISGYSGLNTPNGLILLGFAMGCVLVANRRGNDDVEEGGLCTT